MNQILEASKHCPRGKRPVAVLIPGAVRWGTAIRYEEAGLGAGPGEEREIHSSPRGPGSSPHTRQQQQGFPAQSERGKRKSSATKTVTKCRGSPEAGLGREGREPPQGVESWREKGSCQQLEKHAAGLEADGKRARFRKPAAVL